MQQKPTRFSDSQRRTICRLLFVFCAIVPTLFAIRQVFSPSSPTEIETALRAATGIVASVASVETPRPGFYTLQSVQLPIADGAELMLGTVHVATGTACQIEIPETVRIDCADLTSLVQQFCTVALPTTQAGLTSSTPMVLRCQRVIVSDREFPNDPARQLILSPMVFHFATDSDRSVAAIRFQIAGLSAAPPVEIMIEKPVNSAAGGQLVRVATGDSMIPVWLAKAVWPEAESLLPTGQFSGQIAIAVDAAGRMDGAVGGSLTQADLRHLFSGTCLDMTGIADLLNVQCSIESSRIKSFSTILSAESGSIGMAAADSFSNLGWKVSSPISGEHSTRFLHFQLECNFENGRLAFSPLQEWNQEWNIVAWAEDNRVVVATQNRQTTERMEKLARNLFQNPGTGPARVEALDNRAITFLSCFSLVPETLDEKQTEVRMAEGDRSPAGRF